MHDLEGRVIGPYELGEVVGVGGMATVYRAFQSSLNRTVAVKVLHDRAEDPQFAERFRREAHLMASLQHPAILPVYDYGVEDGVSYLVLQYVEGGRTLSNLIGQPLAVPRVASLVGHMLSGLGHAHERGFVHRDVKPSNVLIAEPEWPLLADFGIAKALQQDVTQLTQTGKLMGTAVYMAPEQALGQPADARTDLYAAGVVLFELLTGRVPFKAHTPTATLMLHAYQPPPALNELVPSLSPEMEAVVRRALAKDPAERYQKAAEMRADLEAVARGGPAPWARGAEAPRAAVVGGGARGSPARGVARGGSDPARTGKRAVLAAFVAGLALVVGMLAYVAWDRVPELIGSPPAFEPVSPEPTPAAAPVANAPPIPVESPVPATPEPAAPPASEPAASEPAAPAPADPGSSPEPPLDAPTDLRAEAVSAGVIRLTWADNSTGETGFRVSNGATEASVDGNVTTFDWTGLRPGSQGCFTVHAVGPDGVSPRTAPVCATTPGQETSVTVPANVTWINTHVAVETGRTLRIVSYGSWTPAAGATPNAGPDGYPDPAPDNFFNLTDLGACATCPTTATAGYGALIGYIGDDPPAPGSYTDADVLLEAEKIFLVGSTYAQPAPTTGTLWLAFNTDAYNADPTHHLGRVTATITVEG